MINCYFGFAVVVCYCVVVDIAAVVLLMLMQLYLCLMLEIDAVVIVAHVVDIAVVFSSMQTCCYAIVVVLVVVVGVAIDVKCLTILMVLYTSSTTLYAQKQTVQFYTRWIFCCSVKMFLQQVVT